ncbi:MAG TPA: DUF3617 family protein [Thermoanaerobaculia bacterium]|nr:DUF3617 family protein [Thermoanaerobaculia bacterium]
MTGKRAAEDFAGGAGPGTARATVLVLSVAAIVSLPGAVGAQKIRPGRYQVKTETTMERDGGSRSMPPTAIAHCYAADDLEDYRKMFPGLQEVCDPTGPNKSAGRLRSTMSCKDGAKGSWEITRGADRFELTIRLRKAGGSHGAATMTVHTVAIRAGDCSP